LESLCVELACLEGGVRAVERALRPPGLLGERALLFFERGAFRALPLGRGVECLADQGVVAVERRELVENGGFELVAGDALPGAALRAELLPAKAGVVVGRCRRCLRRSCRRRRVLQRPQRSSPESK